MNNITYKLIIFISTFLILGGLHNIDILHTHEFYKDFAHDNGVVVLECSMVNCDEFDVIYKRSMFMIIVSLLVMITTFLSFEETKKFSH